MRKQGRKSHTCSTDTNAQRVDISFEGGHTHKCCRAVLAQWILGLWKVRSKISYFLLKYIAFDVNIYKTFIKVTFKVF